MKKKQEHAKNPMIEILKERDDRLIEIYQELKSNMNRMESYMDQLKCIDRSDNNQRMILLNNTTLRSNLYEVYGEIECDILNLSRHMVINETLYDLMYNLKDYRVEEYKIFKEMMRLYMVEPKQKEKINDKKK